MNSNAISPPDAGDPQEVTHEAARLRERGHGAAAEALLRAALASHPEHPELRVALGLTLAELGQDAEAFALLQGVAEADRSRSDAILALGALLLRNGRCEDALSFAEAVALFDPAQAPAALLLIGDAHRAAGSPATAGEAYREADRLAPGQPELMERIAEIEKDLSSPSSRAKARR
ncbi:MAG: tetratricopeptide repeat protein [Deltaproteobacteria bacterium]|nr:tetratricopeptide repeat protein [Deltaproteobacteria bacterium]